MVTELELEPKFVFVQTQNIGSPPQQGINYLGIIKRT